MGGVGRGSQRENGRADEERLKVEGNGMQTALTAVPLQHVHVRVICGNKV